MLEVRCKQPELAAFAAVHKLGCQQIDRQPHRCQPLCRLPDDAHAGLLTISARCLARASLILPASEAVTLPELAGDQVSDAAQGGWRPAHGEASPSEACPC